MEYNRRPATLKPMIDWTALIDLTEPEFYSPIPRGGSRLQGTMPSSAFCSKDGPCTVIDTESAVTESPGVIDPDEEWEGDWSEAEKNYSTVGEEETESQRLALVSCLQALPSPWIVHVPRMEREIKNAFANLGRTPTDCELSERMGLRGITGLIRLFFLLEDLGGTLCTERQNGCCMPDLMQPLNWLLRSLRFRALRVEMQKVLRDAVCDVSTGDNLHMSLHYREEPRRESATLVVFRGHPSEGDVLLDIDVCADDRVCTDKEPDSEKLFQIRTSTSQNGALRRGKLWERFHDNVRLGRNIISWYWLRNSLAPVRWQREIKYHVTIVSK